MQRASLKEEEEKTGNLKPAERVHFIVMRSGCEDMIKLLKELLK
jgi:hypothetical protein